MSVPVGPAQGAGRLTKAEAARRGAELIARLGINAPDHLDRALRPAETFRQRVDWCRLNHPAWTDGKPGPIATMESQLARHILPALGEHPLHALDERTILEFLARLKRSQFERTRRDGTLVKRYTLARKTILNILGVIKTIVGKRIYQQWDIHLGRPAKRSQRYFKPEDMRRIIEAARQPYRTIFAVLTTGLRIGEALGLHVEDVDVPERVIHVRRSVYRGTTQLPKTEHSVRTVDISQGLAEVLRAFIGDRTTGLLFPSRRGGPLSDTNIRNRVLKPLLKQLGLPNAGLHAFRHGAVTLHRRAGTPEHLIRMWVGHSALGNITDHYSHTDQEIEYRRENVLSLDGILPPR